MNRHASIPALSIIAQAALVAGADPREITAFAARIGWGPLDPSRRAFLRAVGLAAVSVGAASVLGETVERALWTPGEKTLVLPPAGGWRPEELRRVLARQPRTLTLTLTAMTREVLAHVADILKQRRWKTEPAFAAQRVGDVARLSHEYPVLLEPADLAGDITVTERVAMMTDQYAVEHIQSPHDGLPDRYGYHEAAPIAAELARAAVDRKLHAFGRLPVLHGADGSVVASDERSGISVRAIRHYDYASGRMLTRFDILGGRV